MWALVPFRGPGGKRRLASLLDEEGRRVLTEAMLADVLAALVSSPSIDHVIVVTPASSPTPEAIAAIGRDDKVTQIVEMPRQAWAPAVDPVKALNGSLAYVQSLVVGRAAADLLLIVPADLPLLSAEDARAMVDATLAIEPGSEGASAIAPDRSETGTNALALYPPGILLPRFGPDSFRAHLAAARERQASCTVVRRAGLALDLDTPDDVGRFLADARSGRTLAALRSLGLERSAGATCDAGRAVHH